MTQADERTRNSHPIDPLGPPTSPIRLQDHWGTRAGSVTVAVLSQIVFGNWTLRKVTLIAGGILHEPEARLPGTLVNPHAPMDEHTTTEKGR